MYTATMEPGPQDHNRHGLLGPSSVMVAYMDPLGSLRVLGLMRAPGSWSN